MALRSRNANLSVILESTQGKTYTVILVTILIVALLIFVAAVPAYLSITNQIVRNDAKTKYLDDLDTKLNNLSGTGGLNDQEKTYSKEIDLLNTLFKDKRNDELIIANVEKISQKDNLVLASLSFNDTDTPTIPEIADLAPLAAVPINITVNGDIADFQKFLKDLEAFPATITVKSVNYSKTIASNNAPTQGYIMLIQAEYYFWNYDK